MPRIKNEKINKDIARYYLMGYTLSEIASKVGVTSRTVSNHLDDIERHWSETWKTGYQEAKLKKIAEINFLKTAIAEKRDLLIEDPTEWRKYTEAIIKLIELEAKIGGMMSGKVIDVSPNQPETNSDNQGDFGGIVGGIQSSLAVKIQWILEAVDNDPGNMQLLEVMEKYIKMYSSVTGVSTFVNHDAAIKTLSDWGYVITHPHAENPITIYSSQSRGADTSELSAPN